MSNGIDKNVMTILTSEVFTCLLASGSVQVAQLNAAIALLIKYSIPFDLSYTSGTRRDAPSAELNIYINPTTTIKFILNFSGGPSIFFNTN